MNDLDIKAHFDIVLCCGDGLDKWEWSMPKVTGKAPSARSYHSAVAIGNSIGACLWIIKTDLRIKADIFDGFLSLS
mgnify:CR=1 FL=1